MNLDGGVNDDPNTIRDNYITGSTTSSIFFNGGTTNGNLVEGNVIDGNAAGIVLVQGEHVVRENQFLNNTAYGVLLYDSARTTDVLIEENLFENNGSGIRVRGGTGANSGHIARLNTFAGNTIAIENLHTDLVNAAENWWGEDRKS